MPIERRINHAELLRELAENRARALELLREAIANAKDHGAQNVWIKTSRRPNAEISVFVADDGEGMDDEGLAAFWGIGASKKPSDKSIGYKGHGSKLFFDSRRLSIATRTTPNAPWRCFAINEPSRFEEVTLVESELDDVLGAELRSTTLGDGTGTGVLIEGVRAEDAKELVAERKAIESYCDWFTVIGDVRAGLFTTRKEWHDAVLAGAANLRAHETPIQPMCLHLRVNGEPGYKPLGTGSSFLAAWRTDADAHGRNPGLLSLGHRFADVHEPKTGVVHLKNDLTALRLTTPETWLHGDVTIVARVEGHRRQVETYGEASWQNHPGVYRFEERFGLWLCKDFVPVVQRNDILREALARASPHALKFDLGKLRNWRVFINDQGLKLTANRNDASNLGAKKDVFITALAEVLREQLKDVEFANWVDRLRTAVSDRERRREMQQMQERHDGIWKWLRATPAKGVDPISVVLERLDDERSLRVREPTSEQELFYVWALLSGRFEVPLFILDYDTREGVDAIAEVHDRALIDRPLARVELKLRVEQRQTLNHFFDAIDVVLCWEVGKLGEIYEEEMSQVTGRLGRRSKPVLASRLDTHEIVISQNTGARVIPVVQLKELFRSKTG